MVDCTPDPNLLESMRSVGYSLNTAVADIIDNSIAAHAKTISIRYFDHGEDPYVAIIDDGDGMDYETAVNAMKLAGTNPNAKRNANDLGRFGLGLKTASLSQARSVMLSTVQHGRQNTLRWDLDHVARTREWDLETLDEEQTNLELPRKVRDLMPSTHGTCVLWRNLDRLGNVAGDSLQDIDQAMLELSGYLGLVFHRFLHPYPEDEIERISITVNDEPVPERDPFLVNNLATQRQRMQRIPGTDATLCGYTLPYQNKLTMEDRGLLDLKQEKGHTLFDTQGFYIYLVERLLDVLFEPVLIMGTTSAPDERIRLAWRTTDQHERTVIPLQTFLCHLDELIITLFEGSLDCLGFGCSPLFWMRILQSFEILTGRSSEIVDVILGQPSIRIHKTASERAQPQCGMRSTLHLYRHDGAEHRLTVFITQGRESFAHTAWSRKQVYDRYWIHGHSENSLN